MGLNCWFELNNVEVSVGDCAVVFCSAVIGSAVIGSAGLAAGVGSAETGVTVLSVVEPEVDSEVLEVVPVVDGFVVFGFIDCFEEIECFLKISVSEFAVFEKNIIVRNTNRKVMF